MLRAVSSSRRREYKSPRRNSSCAAIAETRVRMCRRSAVRNSQLLSSGSLRSNIWMVSISMPPMRAPAASSSSSEGSGSAVGCGGGAGLSMGLNRVSCAATGTEAPQSRMANSNRRMRGISSSEHPSPHRVNRTTPNLRTSSKAKRHGTACIRNCDRCKVATTLQTHIGIRMASDFHPDVRNVMPRLEFSRRELVVTALASGFALAVRPVNAQTVITTDSAGLTAGEIKIPTKDVELPGYRAMPGRGSGFPTVLVVQEVFGVHEHIKDLCRRLAKLGYFAISAELYARQGDVHNVTDIKALMPIVQRVPDAQVMSDLDACVAYAHSS